MHPHDDAGPAMGGGDQWHWSLAYTCPPAEECDAFSHRHRATVEDLQLPTAIHLAQCMQHFFFVKQPPLALYTTVHKYQ
jgi:hypothetical protein